MIQTRKSFLNFSLISPTVKSFGKPALNVVGGWKSTRGNAERMKPSKVMPVKAPNIAQPSRPTKSRRDHKLPTCGLPRAALAAAILAAGCSAWVSAFAISAAPDFGDAAPGAPGCKGSDYVHR